MDGMKDEFDEQFGRAVNCMKQDDSTGELYVLVRSGDGRLVSETIQPDYAYAYMDKAEVMIFDGGNSLGDMWKWTFFPMHRQCFFVDENPLCDDEPRMG